MRVRRNSTAAGRCGSRGQRLSEVVARITATSSGLRLNDVGSITYVAAPVSGAVQLRTGQRLHGTISHVFGQVWWMANAATFLMQRFIFVLVLAVPLRAAVLWALSDDLVKDVDGYRELAVNLRQHGTFGWADPSRSDGIRPTAFRPPLYPALLAPFATDRTVSPLAAGLLHFVMGLATISLVYATAMQWGLGRWSSLAALLTALDPILLHQSAQIMTETLAALLSAAGLFLFTQLLSPGLPTAKGDQQEPEISGGRPGTAPLASAASIATWPEKWRAMLAGAVLGLSVLARPTFLPWLVLCLGAVLMGPTVSYSASARCAHAIRSGYGGPVTLGRPQFLPFRSLEADYDSRRLHAPAGQQPGLLSVLGPRPVGSGLDVGGYG